tara:strand:+ start:214 stop:417 length:204 start_codon:yes stop_codon:yes gene_type:complete
MRLPYAKRCKVEGFVKLLLTIGILYFVVSWAIENPAKANLFVEKVEHTYAYTVNAISDILLDETVEK